jgi:hypothetical protein
MTLSRSAGGGPHKGRCPGHHSLIKGVPCRHQSHLCVGTASGGLPSTIQQSRANGVGSAGSGMCVIHAAVRTTHSDLSG